MAKTDTGFAVIAMLRLSIFVFCSLFNTMSYLQVTQLNIFMISLFILNSFMIPLFSIGIS